MIKLNDDKWSNVTDIQIFCFRFILSVFSVPEYVLRLKELSHMCTNMPCWGAQFSIGVGEISYSYPHMVVWAEYLPMTASFHIIGIGIINYTPVHPFAHVPSIFPFNFSYQSSRTRMREVERNETFPQYISLKKENIFEFNYKEEFFYSLWCPE